MKKRETIGDCFGINHVFRNANDSECQDDS